MATRKRPTQSKAEETEFDPQAIAPNVGTAPLDEEDDGTTSVEPINEHQEDDPSAGQPLGNTTAGMTQGQQAAAAELADYMRRMANLEEEKAAIAEDIKELKKEIKGRGYDVKAFDLITKLDAMSETQKQKRRDQNGINATYAHAVGLDEDLL